MSNRAQRSFAKGEIAPSLHARTDVAQYQAALRRCRNFIVQRHGGAVNRPGTEYLLGVGGSAVRLVPFVYNEAQAYVLVFAGAIVRVVRAGVQVAVVSVPYADADLAQLQWVQSADVLTLVHPAYPPAELQRYGDADWRYSVITFGAGVRAPATLALTPGGPTGTATQWVVTAIGPTGEESAPSAPVGLDGSSAASTQLVTWGAVDGAIGYNVYKSVADGVFGLIGTTTGSAREDGIVGRVAALLVGSAPLAFRDADLTPDLYQQPPVTRAVFAAAGAYPAAVGLYQQRRFFAGADDGPETVWASRTGAYQNFTTSVPLQDDDALTFTIASRQLARLQHLVDDAALFLFGLGGVWAATGDQAGVLRPTDLNVVPVSAHGASSVPPLVVGGRVLYVQNRASIVRALGVAAAMRGAVDDPTEDLTAWAAHLVDGHTIVDWTYQATPFACVWAVRDDGVLLGCTTLPEQELLAWHRHDTAGGQFVAVCAIPEGTEDVLYCVVRRANRLSLERMASRTVRDPLGVDGCFVDASLAYDGTNRNAAATLALTGGTAWDEQEVLTLTASVATFTAADAAHAFHLTGADGTVVRFRVTAYVDPAHVQGFPERQVPVAMRGVPTATWARAVRTVAGLGHLEGQAVAVAADGYLVASPLNPGVAFRPVVHQGALTLDQPYARIRVGLPITADLGTLDIDTAAGPSLKESRLQVSKATVLVDQSRAVFVGPDFPADTAADPMDGLFETKVRDVADDYGPVTLQTGPIEVVFPNRWDSSGRLALRHVDPLPCAVLAVLPTGYLPRG